jgi:hypothetical protein
MEDHLLKGVLGLKKFPAEANMQTALESLGVIKEEASNGLSWQS